MPSCKEELTFYGIGDSDILAWDIAKTLQKEIS